MPIAVGLFFKLFHVGAEAVAAFLMVGTIGGILVATMLNNGGGAWDNAKKFIETGQYGGKGSPAHKAGVVGDRKSTRLNSSHGYISYAVFCLKKKKIYNVRPHIACNDHETY